MIDYAVITKAIQDILEEDLTGYTIVRNARRNVDSDMAAKNKGWIGIYRGPQEIEPYSTGKVWQAHLKPFIVIQVADMRGPDELEDKLQDAEKEVMDVLKADLTLSGTVDHVVGFSVDYEINEDEDAYFQAAIITLECEARTT